MKPQKKFESFQNTISLYGSDLKGREEVDSKLEEMFERQSDGKFYCRTCGKVTIRRTFALEHAETHVEGLEYPCQSCGKSFRSRASIRIHSKTYCNKVR